MPFFSEVFMMLREDGGSNRDFLTYRFWDRSIAMQFLMDVGLLRSKVQCDTCSRDMTWSVDHIIPEGFRWRCRRKVAGVQCSESKSIKHDSRFQQSNLTFQEILRISYDIVRREPAHQIQQDYRLTSHIVADWGMFCREAMLVFMEGCSEKIGGSNNTIETDESKFGRRKYRRGHHVKAQWVFGGVERGSGRTFLVPVPDRTADTLMAIIHDCFFFYFIALPHSSLLNSSQPLPSSLPFASTSSTTNPLLSSTFLFPITSYYNPQITYNRLPLRI